MVIEKQSVHIEEQARAISLSLKKKVAADQRAASCSKLIRKRALLDFDFQRDNGLVISRVQASGPILRFLIGGPGYQRLQFSVE